MTLADEAVAPEEAVLDESLSDRALALSAQ